MKKIDATIANDDRINNLVSFEDANLQMSLDKGNIKSYADFVNDNSLLTNNFVNTEENLNNNKDLNQDCNTTNLNFEYLNHNDNNLILQNFQNKNENAINEIKLSQNENKNESMVTNSESSVTQQDLKQDLKNLSYKDEKVTANDFEQVKGENLQNQNNHILGKFESVQELMKAYKSLEAEFTRKSQELSKIMHKSNETNTQDNFNELIEFSKKYDSDEEFIQNVAKSLNENEELKNDKFGLVKAVYNVLSEKVKTNEQNLQSNDWVYEFVNSNNDIKQKIINEYITNCASGKVPPLIVNTYGSNIVASTPSTPTTLEEVASIMNKWLNN